MEDLAGRPARRDPNRRSEGDCSPAILSPVFSDLFDGKSTLLSNSSSQGGDSNPVQDADDNASPEFEKRLPQDIDRRSMEKTASGKSLSTEKEKLKLCSARIQDLTSSPLSLPLTPIPGKLDTAFQSSSKTREKNDENRAPSYDEPLSPHSHPSKDDPAPPEVTNGELKVSNNSNRNSSNQKALPRTGLLSRRTASSPVLRRKNSAGRTYDHVWGSARQTRAKSVWLGSAQVEDESVDTPTPASSKVLMGDKIMSSTGSAHLMETEILPLPPFSIATHLELELSSELPSPLYIRPSVSQKSPYEESKAKFERLLNLVRLPLLLEQVMCFGTLACLDVWLYTFTILPIRFLSAVVLLARWWTTTACSETTRSFRFVLRSFGRVWHRGRVSFPKSAIYKPSSAEGEAKAEPDSNLPRPLKLDQMSRRGSDWTRSRKRSTLSVLKDQKPSTRPSRLKPGHKADILQGLLFIASCIILMRFDASRMYHSIRGQATIKLYVIYNVLEVCDRLLSALGQDVMECLLSRETLDRDSSGRSKVLRPLLMFALALLYNVVHAAALFYQIITLNVAVNSYSNALLTLLISNQFVEIKGTVFKKFEKENLFQLTCADIVERFQLWLMLIVIGLRNLMEMGITSSPATGSMNPSPSMSGSASNATGIPIRSTSILPKSFTVLPSWSGQVFGPFLLVLGSEMMVDWIKHAYISKFNNTKPEIYSRFLDVLAKDYYSHAFVDQNLTKRLGLPVMPLACLFVRAALQTYHMFLATHMSPAASTSITSLSVDPEIAAASPATTAALAHIDRIFRRAMGRSVSVDGRSFSMWSLDRWSPDDIISVATMVLIGLVAYLVMLAVKLVLSMCLLTLARNRYQSMKDRENKGSDVSSRRVGGFGTVEVNEAKRKWIYADDPEGLRALREREARAKEKDAKGDAALQGVNRYTMVAKRIW